MELAGAPRPLTLVRVERRLRRAPQAELANVRHDADDRERPIVSVHAGVLNELAERILAGPVQLGERGVDHRHVRRVTRIARVERAAAEQGNLHGREVVLTGDSKLRVSTA